MEKENRLGLCWRCEWRALAFETGHGPRHECHSDLLQAKYACYMYRPVKPYIVSKADTKDPRGFVGGYFSARYYPSGLPDMELNYVELNKHSGYVYYTPKKEEIENGKECKCSKSKVSKLSKRTAKSKKK